MREDVTPLQERQQIRLGRPMQHDRQAGFVGGLARPLQHFQVMRQLVVVAVDAHLDREDPIAMLVDDANGRLGIDQRHVEVQLVAEIPDDRDIQHRVDAKRRRVDDELSKAEEGVGAAGSRVDGRRDASRKPDHIRIHGNRIFPYRYRCACTLISPGVTSFPRSVEHFASPGGRNVRRDGGDLSVRDGDIALAVQLLRGVDDAAALDQQIVGSRRLTCSGRRRTGRRRSESSESGIPAEQPPLPRACREKRGDLSVTCSGLHNRGGPQRAALQNIRSRNCALIFAKRAR